MIKDIHPRSGFFPHPSFRGQKSTKNTGSLIRIRNTAGVHGYLFVHFSFCLRWQPLILFSVYGCGIISNWNEFEQSSEHLERHTQWYQGDSKEWELSAKVQTAESDQMSRPTEQQPEQRRRSRAHPGPRCFLRGPTWAMGDYSTLNK